MFRWLPRALRRTPPSRRGRRRHSSAYRTAPAAPRPMCGVRVQTAAQSGEIRRPARTRTTRPPCCSMSAAASREKSRARPESARFPSLTPCAPCHRSSRTPAIRRFPSAEPPRKRTVRRRSPHLPVRPPANAPHRASSLRRTPGTQFSASASAGTARVDRRHRAVSAHTAAACRRRPRRNPAASCP